MGMKIKQESKVRTFFKKIFRFPRKDKDWKHKKLDNNVTNLGSVSSIGNQGKVASKQSLDSIYDKPNRRNSLSPSRDSFDYGKPNASTPQDIYEYGDDWLDTENKRQQEQNILNTEGKKKKKNKKWKVKVNLKETRLVEVKQYEAVDEPDTGSESSINHSKKQKKSNKSKKHKDPLDNKVKDVDACNKVNDEQDLIDVDLNLVLSSFANLRSTSQEKHENLANEQRIHQGVVGSYSSRQVAAHDVAMSEEVLRISTGESEVNTTCDANKNSKRSRRNKNKDKHIDNQNDPETKQKSTTKPPQKQSRQKQKKKKGAYECIENETYQSIELIVSKSRAELPPVVNYDELYTLEQQEQMSKRGKRNKKKKNVRCPEDDFKEELSRDPSRRRKHQDLNISDVIADLETPAESVEHVPIKGRRLRRRRLKVKINKNKKKLDVKRYDELTHPTEEHTKAADTDRDRQTTAREVGRRMWRACKTGWKYMKAGLVYYTRAPANAGNFNPVIQRYEDGFDVFGDPSTSTGRSRY